MARLITTLFVACALALAPVGLGAQSRATIVPSATFSTLYDDNIFAKAIGSADQMMLITPSIESGYETSTMLLLGAYSFDVLRSLLHPTISTLNSRRHAALDTHFQLSPRFTVGFGGRYDRTDSASEFQFVTGILLDRVRAERWQGGPSFTYKLGPRTTANGLFNWISEGVDDSVGSSENVAQVGVTRSTGPRSSAGVSLLGRRFVSASEAIVPSGLPTATVRGDILTFHDGFTVAHGGTFVSVAPLAVWNYEVAPMTRIAVQAGPRYSTARDGIVPEIAAGFGRKAPNVVNYGVDYWRGETIVLGVLGPVEVNSGTARFSVPVRRNVEIGVHGGVFDSQTLSQGNVRVYHAEVVGAWTMRGLYTFAASYGTDFQHGDVRSSLLDDRQITRHLVMLSVTVAPRLSKMFKPDDPLQPIGVPTKGVK
jgi:hypothetical protein